MIWKCCRKNTKRASFGSLFVFTKITAIINIAFFYRLCYNRMKRIKRKSCTMKKFCLLMLVVVLMIGVLVSCRDRKSTTTTASGTQRTSSSTSSTTTTTTAATTTTSRFLTLTFVDQSGEIIDAYTIVKGETLEAPEAPTVSGKNFAGYFDENGAKYDKTFPYQTSMTFKAKYENVPYYTVTFTGEDINTFYRRITPGDDPYILPDPPVRSGYIFDGWYLDSQPYDFNSTVTRDITLVAKWAIGWVVTFVDEQNNVISETTARDGCGVPLPKGDSRSYYTCDSLAALSSITEDTTIVLKKHSYESGTRKTSQGLTTGNSNYYRYFSTDGGVLSYATTLYANNQYLTFKDKFVGGFTCFIGGEKLGVGQTMTIEVLLDGELVNRLTFSTTAREWLTLVSTDTYGEHTVTIRVVDAVGLPAGNGRTGTSVMITACEYRTK